MMDDFFSTSSFHLPRIDLVSTNSCLWDVLHICTVCSTEAWSLVYYNNMNNAFFSCALISLYAVCFHDIYDGYAKQYCVPTVLGVTLHDIYV